MKCPRCGKEMHEIDKGLYTCACGVSLAFEVEEERKPKPKPSDYAAHVPSRCMIDCPERKRCDYINKPMRCATFRAVRVKHLPSLK